MFAQLEFGQALNFQKLPPVDDKITLPFAVEFCVESAAQFLKMPIHNMPGNLFVVSAPSGAGKTSLVRSLLASNQQVDISVSYTTRAPRPSEIDGKDYHFVSHETFLSMEKHGDFVENAKVYGNLYGTSKSWIDAEILSGRDILLEIDWQGAAQVRRTFLDCISIFILPPSLRALENRLNARGQDDAKVIVQRLHAAKEDIAHVVEFDYVIINDELDIALQQLNAIVVAAGLRRDRQLARQQTLINQLQQGEITPWPA